MILPRPEDAIHRMQIYRLLIEILDNSEISHQVYFKGGTCAAMLGFLDRFSLDLDFDLSDKTNKKKLDIELTKIFHKLDLEIKQKSQKELFYVVKYPSKAGQRNTIKLSLLKKTARTNIYQSFYLKDVDRFAFCQTVETMFAHKLVSLTDRYKKYQMIAGRDLYDIHYFFLQGFSYLKKIIKERTGKDAFSYFQELREFIEKKITETIISEDLNYLLPPDKFKKIRNNLKRETILFLENEIKRLSGKF